MAWVRHDSPVDYYTSLSKFADFCRERNVGLAEGVLLAINLHGVNIPGHRRVRIVLRLREDPGTAHLVIVAAQPPSSTPFALTGSELLLAGQPVADVDYTEVDDAIGGYFRNGGHAVTLNPASRSTCTGCVFCPNTLEGSADPYLNTEGELGALIAGLAAQLPDASFRCVDDVVVSSGCFGEEERALTYFAKLRSALELAGFNGRLSILTSVIRSPRALHTLGEQGRSAIWVTVECFERRQLLLKDTKSSLNVETLPAFMDLAARSGVDVTFNYIVGLDPINVAVAGIEPLAHTISMFPNLQVYQAHTAAMAGARALGAGRLDFFLEARDQLERVLGPTGLRPTPWRNYRPLWHYEFNNAPIQGSRI